MKTILLTLFTIAIATCMHAQTADEIIAKHIDAIGGKDKIAQVNSVFIESTSEVMGTEFPSTVTIVNGKGFRSESSFNGQSIIQVVTDNGGWNINPLAGVSSASKMSEDELKFGADQVYSVDALINYAEHGATVELLGKEKAGDIDVYKIKYTNKYGGSITYSIDAVSFYIIQTSQEAMMMGQTTTVTVMLSNYQKTDFGIFMPFTTSMDLGQFSLLMNTKKVEFNKAVDASIFDMPAN